MIRYTLVCENGHDFEGWFRSSDSYDAQAADGLVACLACGSTRVTKAMMAPALAKTVAMVPDKSRAIAEATASDPVAAPSTEVPVMAEPERQLRALMRAMREHVTRTADNVGPRFPEEARRMHYGEAESRAIYGEASPAEARALVEEGIEVAPLPALPGDLN
ncbi:DUF1178 family protein [Methylobacterium sp. W2]|uniref:DUF1178 family protein n=1 Tax=Methylobacterium sp. W2 TaxID=2598107 RepID=UPI001D0BFE6B|nr:DUF1178 family protein [Methylobacterium sp. W2]MCC0805508.1 DUF1178 family protein [Methylobacterium sp. W2]